MYLGYFGFEELPFAITPGTKYFCEVGSHEKVLDGVVNNLKQGEWFIKVIGEVGTGKTLFCRRLLDRLEQLQVFVSVYLYNPPGDLLGLYKMIAQELGIVSPEKKDTFSVLKKINDKLIAYHAQGMQVVVILDEAQALPDELLEGLRLISNLETESKKLVQIVLIGQPELDRRLAQYKLRQLKERITFSYVLRKINTYEEGMRYLDKRLKIAGYPGSLNQLFTDKALLLVLKNGGGIPRRLNILCHRLLLETYLTRRRMIDETVVKSVLSMLNETQQGGESKKGMFAKLRLFRDRMFKREWL